MNVLSTHGRADVGNRRHDRDWRMFALEKDR
jgi:hypothetical protein